MSNHGEYVSELSLFANGSTSTISSTRPFRINAPSSWRYKALNVPDSPVGRLELRGAHYCEIFYSTKYVWGRSMVINTTYLRICKFITVCYKTLKTSVIDGDSNKYVLQRMIVGQSTRPKSSRGSKYVLDDNF